MTYDAMNRMTNVYVPNTGASMSYGYNAGNKRIWRWDGNVDGYGNAGLYTVYFYGSGGQRLAEYTVNAPSIGNTGAGLTVTQVGFDRYFGGRRLGSQDRVGSARGGGLGYYPWGEDKGGTVAQGWGFGTYWKDSTAGLYYADQRWYSSAMGRFLSADPYMASGGAADPGSWNRYSYTRGIR